jgi:excisionase family DNA binding protein
MKLLLAVEAAALLRLSENRVYELAKRRLIPCVRIGRQIRFPEDKLIAWLEAGGSPLEATSPPARNIVDLPRRSGERG